MDLIMEILFSVPKFIAVVMSNLSDANEQMCKCLFICVL